MRVQQLVLPDSPVPSWTVLGKDGFLEPVERFLAHLAAVERSPNTVRAYAYDLRDYFTFLSQQQLEWAAVGVEELAGFVRWLRLPRPVRGTGIRVLPSTPAGLTASSVNRKLSAVSAFYKFHHRCGVDVGRALAVWDGSGRRGGSYEPFLAHLGERRVQLSAVKLPTQQVHTRTLNRDEVQALIGACDRLRDRFLLTLLRETGLRIGEALGLRHEDVDPSGLAVAVRQRVNVNQARAKTRSRSVPVGSQLIQLYSDYLHLEYGELDSDYVFVNLWGQPHGHPMTYAAVLTVVRRLRSRTGISFGPHMFRHTYATDLLRRGVPIEVVRDLLGHASIATTGDTYSHLSVEDNRRALVVAGVMREETENC